MPQLAANLTLMFGDVPFLDRFALAAKTGFKAVEFAFPYDFAATEVATRLRDNGLIAIDMNAPPGNWASGDRGLAAIPGRESEFRDGFWRALDFAAVIGCRLVHTMAGVVTPDTAPLTAASVYAANLSWAAERARQAEVKILLEPINHRDLPHYFLNTTSQAAAIIAGLGSANIALLFDIYHCQITEGDITRRLSELLPIVAHIQIADAPHRHEPGTGEIGWPYVFRKIDELGYSGYVGCEYRPAGQTLDGLKWRSTFGI